MIIRCLTFEDLKGDILILQWSDTTDNLKL